MRRFNEDLFRRDFEGDLESALDYCAYGRDGFLIFRRYALKGGGIYACWKDWDHELGNRSVFCFVGSPALLDIRWRLYLYERKPSMSREDAVITNCPAPETREDVELAFCPPRSFKWWLQGTSYERDWYLNEWMAQAFRSMGLTCEGSDGKPRYRMPYPVRRPAIVDKLLEGGKE